MELNGVSDGDAVNESSAGTYSLGGGNCLPGRVLRAYNVW